MAPSKRRRHAVAAAALRALAVAALASAAAAPLPPPLMSRASSALGATTRPGRGGPTVHPRASAKQLASCETRTFEQALDHFGADQARYQQRYIVCDASWGGEGHPVFFYAGNEADVWLYVNHTGLMWELAPSFKALLVFAEHRYYGESVPRMGGLAHLSTGQALADYAVLLDHLRRTIAGADAPAIAFGGSYGGMLAAWLRMHYPWSVAGAIAASAPIWAFPGETPPVDPGGFAAVVTADAGEGAGAPAGCQAALRRAWGALFAAGAAPDGPAALSVRFRSCPGAELRSADDVTALAYWLQSAWDFMAMGDFPYESDYLTNGGATLPAYPVRAACAPLAAAARTGGGDGALLDALLEASLVFYNATGELACVDVSAGVNNETQRDGDQWDYQACTEMVMPMSRDGVRDAFWPQPWDAAAFDEGCRARWGVTPRPLWAEAAYGGRRIASASNIVFSNGGLDPWRYAGVLRSPSHKAVALNIPSGAHHLDLMFAHPADPPDVARARARAKREIQRWLRAARRRAARARHVARGGVWRLAVEWGLWLPHRGGAMRQVTALAAGAGLGWAAAGFSRRRAAASAPSAPKPARAV